MRVQAVWTDVKMIIHHICIIDAIGQGERDDSDLI